MRFMLRYANFFVDGSNTRTRISTNTGHILLSTPTNDSIGAVICGIGRGRLDTSSIVISNTSYAAGYLTPVTGMLGSRFKVIRNLVAAVRTCANSRGALSTPRPGNSFHHTHTTTTGVIPGAANTTGTVNSMLPRLGNGLSKTTRHIPIPANSLARLIAMLRGTMAIRRVGTTVGTTTGRSCNCARSRLISASVMKVGFNSLFSTARAGIVAIKSGRLIGAIT